MSRTTVLPMLAQSSRCHSAPLRRADWRFLLPSPAGGTFQHLVLLGGPPGLAERLGEVGLARSVSCTLPQTRNADVVAVLHDAGVALSDAVRYLRSGGVLYYEVNRRSPALFSCTPGRIRQRLRAVGLLPTGVYAVKPNFDACEVYLPVEAREALKWYVTSLYTAATPLGRLFETGLRVLTGFQSRWFALFAPYYAVTAVAGAVSPPVSSLLGHLTLPTLLQHAQLYPFLLADGGNRVALLPFTRTGSQPEAVLKVPKLSGFNAKTENEQMTLTTVRSQLDSALRQAIPQPLGLFQHGKITIGAESYAPGRSLLSSSGRWGAPLRQKIDDLRLAAGWLADFHLQTLVSRTPWDGTALSHWVDTPFSAYRQLFGMNSKEEQLFTRARQYATTLDGVPFPIVWQHRDFNVWNIFRSGRALSVIDWEGGRLGPALCDLFHFVTHWHDVVCQLRNETAPLQGFRALFFASDPRKRIVRTVHETLRLYMQRLDLDPRFYPLLLVYTWVELALRRADQQRTLEGGEADGRSGNRQVRYVGVLAEHSEQLFANVTVAPSYAQMSIE